VADREWKLGANLERQVATKTNDFHGAISVEPTR
jgi:hypothetical protein